MGKYTNIVWNNMNFNDYTEWNDYVRVSKEWKENLCAEFEKQVLSRYPNTVKNWTDLDLNARYEKAFQWWPHWAFSLRSTFIDNEWMYNTQWTYERG